MDGPTSGSFNLMRIAGLALLIIGGGWAGKTSLLKPELMKSPILLLFSIFSFNVILAQASQRELKPIWMTFTVYTILLVMACC